MSHDIKAIIANPENYGLAFSMEDVSLKGRGDKAHNVLAIIPVITDLAKFQTEFGETVALGFINGAGSLRVESQDWNRRAWGASKVEGGTRPTEASLKEFVVERLCGVKGQRVAVRTVEKETFLGADGNKYATSDEAKAASLAWALDQMAEKEEA